MSAHILYRWTGHDVTDVGVQEFASVVKDVEKGPLTVHVEVWEVRPRSHYGTGGREGILKESAPAYPAGKAFTMIGWAQGFADQCEGAVWEPGAVTALMLSSRFALFDTDPKIRVTVSRAPVETIGDLVRARWENPPHALAAYRAP